MPRRTPPSRSGRSRIADQLACAESSYLARLVHTLFITTVIAREKFPAARRAAQRLAQPAAAAAEPRLDRAELDAGDRGDLVVAVALHVAEDHHQALVVRQLRQGQLERARQLQPLGARLRLLARRQRAPLHARLEAELVEGAGRAALAAAQLVVAAVGGDAQQPGAEDA